MRQKQLCDLEQYYQTRRYITPDKKSMIKASQTNNSIQQISNKHPQILSKSEQGKIYDTINKLIQKQCQNNYLQKKIDNQTQIREQQITQLTKEKQALQQQNQKLLKKYIKNKNLFEKLAEKQNSKKIRELSTQFNILNNQDIQDNLQEKFIQDNQQKIGQNLRQINQSAQMSCQKLNQFEDNQKKTNRIYLKKSNTYTQSFQSENFQDDKLSDYQKNNSKSFEKQDINLLQDQMNKIQQLQTQVKLLTRAVIEKNNQDAKIEEQNDKNHQNKQIQLEQVQKNLQKSLDKKKNKNRFLNIKKLLKPNEQIVNQNKSKKDIIKNQVYQIQSPNDNNRLQDDVLIDLLNDTFNNVRNQNTIINENVFDIVDHLENTFLNENQLIMNLFLLLFYFVCFDNILTTQICGLIEIFEQLQKLDQTNVLTAQRNFKEQIELNQLTVFGWFQFQNFQTLNPILRTILIQQDEKNQVLFDIFYLQEEQQNYFQLIFNKDAIKQVKIDLKLENMKWFQFAVTFSLEEKNLTFQIKNFDQVQKQTTLINVQNQKTFIEGIEFQFGCFLSQQQIENKEQLETCSQGFVNSSYFMFEQNKNLDYLYLITKSKPFVDNYVFNLQYKDKIESKNTQNIISFENQIIEQGHNLKSNQAFQYKLELKQNLIQSPTFVFQVQFEQQFEFQQKILTIISQSENKEQYIIINLNQQQSILEIQLNINDQNEQIFQGQINLNTLNTIFISFIKFNQLLYVFIKLNQDQIFLSQVQNFQNFNFQIAKINSEENQPNTYKNISGIITSQFRDNNTFCSKGCNVFLQDYFNDRLCVDCQQNQVYIAQLSKCYEFCPKGSFQNKGVCTKCQIQNCQEIIQPRISINRSTDQNIFFVGTDKIENVDFSKTDPIKVSINNQILDKSLYQVLPIDNQNAQFVLDNNLQGQVTFDLKDNILAYDQNRNQIQNQQTSFNIEKSQLNQNNLNLQNNQDDNTSNIQTNQQTNGNTFLSNNLQSQVVPIIQSQQSKTLENNLQQQNEEDNTQIIQNFESFNNQIIPNQQNNIVQVQSQQLNQDMLSLNIKPFQQTGNIIQPKMIILDGSIIQPIQPIVEGQFIETLSPLIDAIVIKNQQIQENVQKDQNLDKVDQNIEIQTLSQNLNNEKLILLQKDLKINSYEPEFISNIIQNNEQYIKQKRDKTVEHNFYYFGQFIFILYMVQFGIGLLRELIINKNYNRNSFVYQKWIQVFLLGQYIIFFLCYNVSLPYNFKQFLQGFFSVFIGTHDIFRNSIIQEYKQTRNFKEAYMNQNYQSFTENNISTTFIINFGLIIIIQLAFVVLLVILSCCFSQLKLNPTRRNNCLKIILIYLYNQIVFKFIITIFLLFTVEMCVFMFYNFATDILQYTNLGILQFSVFISFLYIILTVVIALVLLLNTEKEYSTQDVEFMLRGVKVEGLQRKYIFFQYFYFLLFSFLLVVLYQSQLWQAISTFLLCFLMFLYVLIFRPPIHIFYRYEQIITFIFLLALHLLILLLAVDEDNINYTKNTRWNIGYALAIISIVLLIYGFLIVIVDSIKEIFQYCKYKQIDREIDNVNEEVNNIQDIENNQVQNNINNLNTPNPVIGNIQESFQIQQPQYSNVNTIQQNQVAENLLSKEQNFYDNERQQKQMELKNTLADLKKKMLETQKKIEMKKRLKDQIKIKRFNQNTGVDNNFKKIQQLKGQKNMYDLKDEQQIFEQPQQYQESDNETLLQINQDLMDLADDILNSQRRD